MRISLLKSKIHRATITGADLHYEGSITVGSQLMEMAHLFPFEKVDIYNISNGERFTTYVIEGDQERAICLNGAAAWKGAVGDRIILVSYCEMEAEEAKNFVPTIIKMGADNHIQGLSGV